MSIDSYYANGFAKLHNVISKGYADTLSKDIESAIHNCASQIKCSTAEYLASASRWVHPSPITNTINLEILGSIKNLLSEMFQSKITLVKYNVISKSSYAMQRVPCHQDLSYASNDPYGFSLWTALTDVTESTGALQLLPGSHREPLQPAIDFWQPSFIDKVAGSSNWRKHAVTIPVEAGDAILFSSRIWHGSVDNLEKNLRLALVTRWKSSEYQVPAIPEKVPAFFGMWNCNSITYKILNDGMHNIYNEYIDSMQFITLIELWIDKIKKNGLPWESSIDEIISPLKQLRILHLASTLHNGGDALGIIYANVWRVLLKPIQAYLANNINKEAMNLL